MKDYTRMLGFMGDTPTYKILELSDRWHVDIIDPILRRGTERGEVTDYDTTMPNEPHGHRKHQLIMVNSGNSKWDYLSIAPGIFDTVDVEFLETKSDVSGKELVEGASDIVYKELNNFTKFKLRPDRPI